MMGRVLNRLPVTCVSKEASISTKNLLLLKSSLDYEGGKIMFNTKEGYSLSDIAAVTGSNNGFDGNGFGGWWIILLFLFAFGGWGNGFGGWGPGNNGTAVTADIGYNFDMHDISSGVRDLASSTANGFYNINTGLLNGFSGTQAQICNTGFDTIQAINANSLSAL
jgi:hypothetical protein